MAAYPSDSEHFCGLYGYQMTYTPCNFLGGSNRFYLVQSEFKGQTRIYIADLENKNQVRWVDYLGKSDTPRDGDYGLIRLREDVAITYFSSVSCPPMIHMVTFGNVQNT